MTETKTPRRRRKAAPVNPEALVYIVEALRPLAVPIASVSADPANARKHDGRNIEAIKGSLRRFGQRKPIVVNRRTGGTTEAGAGTLEAARQLGWGYIAVVQVDDDPTTAAAFGIADNRTAELAEWNEPELARLIQSLADEDRAATGFDDGEIAALLERVDADGVPDSDVADTSPQLGAFRFSVIVECRDETHQAELLARFNDEGLTTRALTA